MFDSSVLDVAIGMIALFFVSSLMASAIVEAVGGFLHRRQKHLWDTLDLLLGETSRAASTSPAEMVEKLYKTPFVTGLVRPSDRGKFDPAEGAKSGSQKAPLRSVTGSKNPKTRVTGSQENRRFYGPSTIAASEFASALLSVIRPDGELDKAMAALNAMEPKAGSTDVVLANVHSGLVALRDSAIAMNALDLSAAMQGVLDAATDIKIADFKKLVTEARATLAKVAAGEHQGALLSSFALLPVDLQTKLQSIALTAGQSTISVRTNIEEWFDRHMAAASTWYRRQTRWFLFLAGLVMAVSLNMDAIATASTLYRDDGARAAVLVTAEQVAKSTCLTGDADSQGELTCVRKEVGGAISLPIGWNDVDTTTNGWVVRLLGWLIVAASVTLGAPFWFDLLRRAMNVRQTKSTA